MHSVVNGCIPITDDDRTRVDQESEEGACVWLRAVGISSLSRSAWLLVPLLLPDFFELSLREEDISVHDDRSGRVTYLLQLALIQAGRLLTNAATAVVSDPCHLA